MAPCRLEIEPSRIYSILPETFIIEKKIDQSYAFRLAGTRICQQFGRELRGHDCVTIWRREDRQMIEELLDSLSADGRVGLIKFTGSTDTGRSATFEMIVLPLLHPDQNQLISRFLGAIAVSGNTYWLGSWPLTELAVNSIECFWTRDDGSICNKSQPGQNASTNNGQPKKVLRKYEEYHKSDGVRVVRSDHREFRIYEGGLAEN